MKNILAWLDASHKLAYYALVILYVVDRCMGLASLTSVAVSAIAI